MGLAYAPILMERKEVASLVMGEGIVINGSGMTHV
jgi:mannitol/fructose-specific phosphotransferase system IIA component